VSSLPVENITKNRKVSENNESTKTRGTMKQAMTKNK
jgi:hypothetical protein